MTLKYYGKRNLVSTIKQEINTWPVFIYENLVLNVRVEDRQ